VRARVVLVTGNQGKRDEIARLLADVDVTWRKLSLPRPPASTLGELARARALAAWAELGEPCVTESTELALERLPVLSGADFKRRLLAEGEAALCRELGGRRGQARVAVAHAASADVAAVQLFEGASEGEFLTQPRGDGGHGWDRAWLPDGYQRTLGEMAGNKAFVGMRERPYLELADVLRGRSFGGTFEAHVTVRAGGVADTARFGELCDRLGVKQVLIELPRGETRSQPMTASYHHGTLREAQAEVHAMARALAAAGFDVTRVKLEALGQNRDIPEDDAAAQALPANYFEFHVKVTLPAEAAVDALRERVVARGAHLSKNARKLREDGRQERFVTLRVYGVGRPAADARFDALLAELVATGLPLGQRIREYTVYDSDVAVDRGWLP
jgi:inosine/xanthosine triphosphate pyrophosphatase family protein